MSLFQSAFASDSALLARVSYAANNDAKIGLLLHDISAYIVALRNNNNNNDQIDSLSKKRKLGHDVVSGANTSSNGANALSWQNDAPVFVAPDISVAVPIRKKLKLEVLRGGVTVCTTEGERALGIAWSDINQAICVPVPEKAQPAYNVVILPVAQPSSSPTIEAIVFTIPGGPAKNVSFPGSSNSVQEGESYESLLRRVFNERLAPFRKAVVVPDEREFVSGLVQAHRKGEKGWHVKAWRGSKDGFLYFLSTGILFGFRKPLLFFPFHNITSISYSSVLQRTFNLNVTHSTVINAGRQEEELEFAMLDQADFAGIDAYIKRRQLNDASLAESRRAVVYNVNAVKQEQEDGHANGRSNNAPIDEDGGEDDFARREKELQDAEDAEEEDYDPSGGSSEGSGEDSDEAEDPGDDGGEQEEDFDEEIDEEVGGYEDEVEEG